MIGSFLSYQLEKISLKKVFPHGETVFVQLRTEGLS
jgi:hypothetical protein